MYHSYLRGKQYELLAIRRSVEKIAQAKIVPIIEPVRDSLRDITKCVQVLRDNKANYIVVANPQCGDLANNQVGSEKILDSLVSSDPEIELGFIVDEGTSVSQVRSFVERFKGQLFSLIHYGRFDDIDGLQELLDSEASFNKHIFIEAENSNSYRKRFTSARKVLIRDSFKRKAPNAEYGKTLEEFFSDLHSSYEELGYMGYGDFSVIGDHYSEGGGQAITAVLHVTYDNVDEDIYIRHFLSDPRTVPDEVPILLEEALERLEEFLLDNPEILKWSTSCAELMDIYKGGCQTNLAVMKKLTMSHHFELMHKISD